MPEPELHGWMNPGAFQNLGEGPLCLLDVLRVDVVEDTVLDHLFLSIAQYPLDRGALVADYAFCIQGSDDVRGVLDQGAEPLLALAELRLRLLGSVMSLMMLCAAGLPS